MDDEQAADSSSFTNESLVDGLARDASLSPAVEAAFRRVDRASFWPSDRDLGYQRADSELYGDQPLRGGAFHQSAPHIYAAVLESLALDRSVSVNVLVVGSGTGYFCMLIAQIVAPDSVIHGCDIEDRDGFRGAADAFTARWFDKDRGAASGAPSAAVARPRYFTCDGYLIDPKVNIQYDRIYVAAGAPVAALSHFLDLLAPGGVLVGPFGDELMRVTTASGGSPGPGAPRARVLARVAFASLRGMPLAPRTARTVVLAPARWSATDARAFRDLPPPFRAAAVALRIVELRGGGGRAHAAAAMLPREVWDRVLGMCPRTWFDPEPSEAEQLRAELARERCARQLLEQHLATVERERDEAIQACMLLQLQLQGDAPSNSDSDSAQDFESDSESTSQEGLQMQLDASTSECAGAGEQSR